MRILMSSGIYPLAGSSIVIENLAKNLCKTGIEVTIGALRFKRFPPKVAYDVAKIPVGNVLKLARFLKKFDVIHNHHPLTNYLALISNNPFIYHYHGTSYSGKALQKINMFSSIKMAGNRFDAIIAVSEAAATELTQHFRSDKIFVIYNGVDTKLFKPAIEPKFRKGKPQILFVGNLYKHKHVEELIFATRALLKAYPKACLQIVGTGFMYERLKNLVAELGLEKHVELIGRVSDFELPYYYGSCDVYVTASHWELFGLPLLEAMACGKPVVASSIPSHMELLNKSKAGELYPMGDVEALCRKIIGTYEESENYRDAALIFAKKNDWSNIAVQVSRIYAQMLH
jgi:glycosyltransferase involved in cell wall biosynthesis